MSTYEAMIERLAQHDPMLLLSPSQPAGDVVYDAEEQAIDLAYQDNQVGIPNLKKLKPIHMRILACHMTGMKMSDIARVFTDMGIPISYFTVYRTVHDPISERLLEKYYASADVEMKALEPLAVDALRKGLVAGTIKDGVNAADKVFKANGRYGRAEGNDTAEDVIARMMGAIEQQAGAIHSLADRRRPMQIIDMKPVPTEESGDK